MYHTLRFLLFSVLLLPLACMPPEADQRTPRKGVVDLDPRNPRLQRLYDLRDRHQTDSLRRYLTDPDAGLRYLAALSFASMRDSGAVDALVPCLRDAVEEVRIAAAFSLGQIGTVACEKPLLEAFDARDSLSQHQRFNAVVLEAIGKCGQLPSLKHLAAITTYQPTDTLLLEGQCRAIYRFGQRKLTDATATARMVAMVANERIPEPARMMAANYLARTEDIAPDSAQAVQMAVALVRAVNSPDVRMALAKGLGKSRTGPAFGILSKVIGTEQDWRVKCNIINALAKFDYDTVRTLVFARLFDPNVQIARTAAEFFIANGQIRDSDYYWRIARENANLPLPVQIALFRASNKWLSGKTEPESKDFVNYRLREMFVQAKNPYDRAACLAALGEFSWQYRWIHDKGFSDVHPAVKTAAAEALVAIAQKPNFYAFFGEAAKGARRELYFYFREAVGTADAGLVASAAPGLRTPILNYRSLRDSLRVPELQRVLGKLKMPRDVEAYAALNQTIAYFLEKPLPASPAIPFNHPIDWDRLKLVTSATTVTIETAKGNIVLAMYPQWAPGTVANFLQLAGTSFYNGKTFHRVVPNFVTQGGCPRGDGYGAEDYTLRTEIGLAWYDAAGYLGMASAGADTEGTQFFITHSPAPHLEGQYTIFGKVLTGMDVVDQLQPGDVMNKVTVNYQ